MYGDEIVTMANSMPEWKVYYGAFFGERAYRQRAGRKRFGLETTRLIWGDEEWQIPALYLCGKGLVVDFLCKVPVPKRIQDFLERWQLDADEEHSGILHKSNGFVWSRKIL